MKFPHERIPPTWISPKSIILNEEGSVAIGNLGCDATYKRFKNVNPYSILLTDIRPHHKSIVTGTQIKTAIFRIIVTSGGVGG